MGEPFSTELLRMYYGALPHRHCAGGCRLQRASNHPARVGVVHARRPLLRARTPGPPRARALAASAVLLTGPHAHALVGDGCLSSLRARGTRRRRPPPVASIGDDAEGEWTAVVDSAADVVADCSALPTPVRAPSYLPARLFPYEAMTRWLSYGSKSTLHHREVSRRAGAQ